MRSAAAQSTSPEHGLRARLKSPVVQFATAAMAAVAVVGAVAAILLNRAADDEAIRDAKRVTALAGEGIVEPAVTARLLTGEPSALRRMEALVRERILSRNGVARVKIWDEDARIIYSDEPRLIGRKFSFSPEDRATLKNGGTEAAKTDLARPENRFERGDGELLEVYLPIHAPDGDPLLFESYIKASAVASASQRVWSTLAPVLIGALLVLAVLQLPLATSLTRRLRRGQQEREALLTRAIDASEMERRRIAQDLHRTCTEPASRRRSPMSGPASTPAGSRRCSTSPRILRFQQSSRRSSSASPRRPFATWSRTPRRAPSRFAWRPTTDS